MKIIPLIATPSQTLAVLLTSQPCRINVYQKGASLYLDLYINDVLILGGVICENRNRIVRSTYLGFIGDLSFLDMQGSDDPNYAGLGSRFILLYIEPSDTVA